MLEGHKNCYAILHIQGVQFKAKPVCIIQHVHFSRRGVEDVLNA
jgi:hypothetical protein